MTSETSAPAPLKIAVLGAGGRAGRTITAEATARGHSVTSVVREPQRHLDLQGDHVTLVAGDALDTVSMATTVSGCAAIVSAVTPFTAPPASFDDFDTTYYERVADTLITTATTMSVTRVVVISLFATLDLPGGGKVLDDPALFPPQLRPFAAAHAAGTERLKLSGGAVDWLSLAPPPQLTADTPATRTYRLGDHTADTTALATPLSYADLAVAVIDQIEQPTRHREHVAVYGT